MYSLFCEAKFWTLINDIQIRNTDFGVYRYYDKKEVDECPYLEGKKSYSDQRGTTFVLKNKRPLKLKDRLKELEQQLTNNKIVFFDWKDSNILHLILNTGLIIVIGVDVHNKDIFKIAFDRFLIGKLLSENICDVLSTPTHLIISYNENQLTIVNYSKPYTRFNLPQKLGKLEPRVQQVELSGPAGRRIDRKLSLSKLGDMILTWWHSTRNEVYPWSPLVKDEDRANLHIYSLIGTKIKLLCFYRTEFDLVNVSFSQVKPNLFWLIEQKVSKKGEVTVEYSSHEIIKKVLKKISVTSIPLQTQVCCHSISPDEEKLVLGCIDGSLILFDDTRGVTRLVKTAFIPNIVSWHNDGALIIAANERCQFQFFDFALSCLRAQILSEDVTPSNLIDLASYFKAQPILLHMKWNKKSNASCYADRFIPTDSLLFLIFESGPLGVLNLIGGGGLSNDVQNCGLKADTIIKQYLMWNQSDKALNLLLSLNWNTSGSACLAGLYHIANYIFRHPFTPEKEIQLEAALGSFYAPIRPLTRLTESEFGNQVHDLTRRFFHHLLRHKLYEKAYCLAIDLSSADLFVDLYHCAKLLKDEEMAFACSAKVEEVNSVSENSSHSCCSHSSCSCSVEEDDEEDGILPPLPQVSVKKSKACRVPPLPDLNRNNKLRSSAFFNCNPTYLQPEALPEERTSEMSNGFGSQIASTSFTEFYPSLLKSFEYGYSTTQILTPEFPHSYEIRTSFLGQEGGGNNFIPIEPQNHRTQKPPDVFSYRQNNLGVIENLYDLPKEMNIPTPEEIVKKDFFLSRPDPPPNAANPLRLRSARVSSHNTLCPRINNTPNLPKFGSFDYNLKTSPLGPRITCDEEQATPRITSPINYQLHRGFTPKISTFISPPLHYKDFNNITMQRPLHFVPNTHPKQVVKQINPSTPKQKVKFSDTVTQIVVPDISKISIEDETIKAQHKPRNSRIARPTVPPSTDYVDCPVSLKNPNHPGDFSSRQDQQEEEENSGTIKVIHFGVV